MNEQTHTTEEAIPNEETNKEVNTNSNAEQTKPEENGAASRAQEPGQVDFSQMYDMLTERDNTIKKLTTEISDLKKSNTELLLKVNSSKSADNSFKNPYENFIDTMVNR